MPFCQKKGFISEENACTKKHEEKAVDLKDVTGTGFEHIKPISLLMAGIACVAVAVLLLLILISR